MPATAAARQFLTREGARGADFSGCLILVPHHHAGQALREALGRCVGGAVLPPRLLTLPEWADTLPSPVRPAPQSRVLAHLHDLLARMPKLLAHVPLWQAAQELAGLAAEMEEAGLGLDALDELRRRPNAYLSAEAAIADTVWRACREGFALPARLQAERLFALARQAAHPLYHFGLIGLSRQEARFLALWAERQEVIELVMPPAFPERLALLDAAWAGADAPPLRQRAQTHARTQATSPAAQAWTLRPAANLEAAANAAVAQVAEWTGRGHRRIALVALDRMLARRVRALLERRAILVQDETGWAMSTAAASHVLERWTGLLGQGMFHADLLDLLKSPFVHAAADPDLAVSQLEQAFRRHGAPRDLAGHQALAREYGLGAASEALARIARARNAFPSGRARLAAWTEGLLASLEALGAQAALAADPIGAQILALLRGLAQECAGHPTAYPLTEWRRWLALHLETATFTDASVESPIRLTHLAAAHHRDWEGVLLLGAGAAHLPARTRARVFNDATRLQLGLPGALEREAAQRQALADLLARAPAAALVWQSEEAGEEQPLSPWLVQLDAFHSIAWGRGLVRDAGRAAGGSAGLKADPPPSDPVRAMPPERMTVSAWQSLLNCPFQFHARHLLRLNEPDETPEAMDKADYGSLLHGILARFHRRFPRLAEALPETLEAALQEASQSAFGAVEARDYEALAWRLRWQRQIPAYLAWALGWEARGYRFESAETALSAEIEWAGTAAEAGRTRLEGRADRIDAREDALVALDYKTQSRQTLKQKLAPEAEDAQLTAYAWLAGAAEAAFVALDERDRVTELAWPGDLAVAAGEEALRLRDTLSAMACGAAIPAHGAPSACAWCEMRGLCRVEHRAPASMP
ncbi:MAG: PD-(D/E)XK nuclease family protein [Betaproteobacteria bacterium]|nr:PD-(D/E)XK nuclease family protein [Betaproteobacteria bacterium]